MVVKAEAKGEENPNGKKALTGLAGSWGKAPQYQIPSKSQLPNLNGFSEIGSIGVWDLFGSIGIILGFGISDRRVEPKTLYTPFSV